MVLTAVETESFSGYLWPELMDVFPGQQPVERSSMNSWDDPGFRAAIEATGKKNIVIAGLWTEVCVTWPTLNLLAAGYNVYIVEDACGETSQAAHDAALRRCVQAGAVPLTSVATVLEFQRDWANREHYDAVLQVSASTAAPTAAASSMPTPWCTRRPRRPRTPTSSRSSRTDLRRAGLEDLPAAG